MVRSSPIRPHSESLVKRMDSNRSPEGLRSTDRPRELDRLRIACKTCTSALLAVAQLPCPLGAQVGCAGNRLETIACKHIREAVPRRRQHTASARFRQDVPGILNRLENYMNYIGFALDGAPHLYGQQRQQRRSSGKQWKSIAPRPLREGRPPRRATHSISASGRTPSAPLWFRRKNTNRL